MKLYCVHCGYYDQEIADGIYESHVNYFVAADSFEGARSKVKSLPVVASRKMHVDGIQEIQIVNGYKIVLEKLDLEETLILNNRHRDLAPKVIV